MNLHLDVFVFVTFELDADLGFEVAVFWVFVEVLEVFDVDGDFHAQWGLDVRPCVGGRCIL